MCGSVKCVVSPFLPPRPGVRPRKERVISVLLRPFFELITRNKMHERTMRLLVVACSAFVLFGVAAAANTLGVTVNKNNGDCFTGLERRMGFISFRT